MTSESLTRFVEGRPFIPFQIYTADGRILPVTHPEFASLERFALSVTIYDTAGHAEVVDAALIVSIRTLQPLP